jgi:pimeloyl-ACP methyl ester carboxylesterase
VFKLTLPDRRILSYDIYGDSEGYPVIYCHGFPACRLEARLFDEPARVHGVCLIAADRPGYGGSSFQPGRRLSHWREDMRYLANHLAITEYSVLGMSGGVPYAVCCAASSDPRIRRLGIICGLGPMHEAGGERYMGAAARAFISLSRNFPGLAVPLNTRIVGPFMYHFPRCVTYILTAVAPQSDREVFTERDARDVYTETIREAFKQGGLGAARDLYLYTHPWEFDAGEVQAPAWLWHGEADRTVPVAMGRAYAARLPRCRAKFYPGEGHFSLPVQVVDEVLLAMKDAGDYASANRRVQADTYLLA